MNQIREIIHRLQQGQSRRQIAKDLHVSRHTITKYSQMAEQEGYLGKNHRLPNGKELLAKLGPAQVSPTRESGVIPYKEVVERLLGLCSGGPSLLQSLAAARLVCFPCRAPLVPRSL